MSRASIKPDRVPETFEALSVLRPLRPQRKSLSK